MKELLKTNYLRQIAGLLLFLGACYLVAWAGAQASTLTYTIWSLN